MTPRIVVLALLWLLRDVSARGTLQGSVEVKQKKNMASSPAAEAVCFTVCDARRKVG